MLDAHEKRMDGVDGPKSVHKKKKSAGKVSCDMVIVAHFCRIFTVHVRPFGFLLAFKNALGSSLF
jgi:hypothetical protein